MAAAIVGKGEEAVSKREGVERQEEERGRVGGDMAGDSGGVKLAAASA